MGVCVCMGGVTNHAAGADPGEGGGGGGGGGGL